HPDGHYCLASVKGVRQFAHAFPNVSVIISQDHKAKIGLVIPAVGRTFCTLQSVSEPVQLPDHDFACRNSQKLIPSVYLMIKPNEENDDLRTGQVAIFVRPQWSIGTSSITHAEDLISLVSDNQYSEALKINNEIKPIWVLLVDGGPDENPRHFKNIESYCKLFKKFDLDYLTVRTHAPGQSKYNPVERSMATLLGKLAGIVLPIDHFGKHLDSQSNVNDTNLATQNFNYAGTMLCDIWRRDPIFGKHDDISVPWNWIEKHCNLCQYSLDVKRSSEVTEFLRLSNGFFPPVNRAKDGHYINPVHLFQYSEQFKVPNYDKHCPSISQTAYSRLCCSVCHKYFPTLAYITKHKREMHPSARGRPKKSQPKNSESVVEAV
ncbi:26266_t:CDS:2, partial [Gigaspora margarita]